jgi:predicted RNA-binding protein with PIN domain
MKKEINIKTYFITFDGIESLHQEIKFNNWDEVETFLKDRIQILNRNEIFKIEFGENKFAELNKYSFNSLTKIKEHFFEIINTNAERKKNKFAERKRSRIEIRIDEEEKKNILKKCEHININISDYTRHLYKYGEIRIVPEQLTKDIRGMAVNINQIAKRVNSGLISQNDTISELQIILLKLQNLYNNQ